MNFIILRTLRQSELGWFGEIRRNGRETSRQRALNFDASEVERMFPMAVRGDAIVVSLSRRNDSGEIVTQQQVLRRQEKNWRLTGDKVDDQRFGQCAPGDLVVMAWSVGEEGAEGAFEVLSPTSPEAGRLAAHPQTGMLSQRGLVAIEAGHARSLAAELLSIDRDLFGAFLPPLGDRTPRDAPAADGVGSPGPLTVPPSPKRMFQMIGSMGHSLHIAAADIIDNSIAAGATKAEVIFQSPDRSGGALFPAQFPGGCIAFRDNGRGMARADLIEAMKFGSDRDYAERDLGRYGIGLKAASFSQCRCLTVASRTASSEITVLRWDQDHVDRTGEWEVLEPVLKENERTALLEPLRAGPGTVVLWTRLRALELGDRRGKRGAPAESSHGRMLGELSVHLGMVFHRFITGQTRAGRTLVLSLNDEPVSAWDPFLCTHARTSASTEFSHPLRAPESDVPRPVVVSAWLLPHTSVLTPEEFKSAGQFGRWNELQGFYIYRADRIIQAGGWCDIWNLEEHKKLLRVAISFDPELDTAFEVHAAKMAVSLPLELTQVLQLKLQDARKEADQRYRLDGKEKRPAAVRVAGPAGATAVAPTALPTHRRPPAAPEARERPIAAPVASPNPRVANTGGGGAGTHPFQPALFLPLPPVDTKSGVQDPGALAETLELKDNLSGELWRLHKPLAGPAEVFVARTDPAMAPLVAAVKDLPEARRALARFLAAIEEGVLASGGQQATFMPFVHARLSERGE